MRRTAHLPKFPTNLPILFAVILIIFLTLGLFLIFQANQSQLLISSDANKFKVAFVIASRDREHFANFLQKLSLPQNIKNGFEFELDATSQARLALHLPISVNFGFSKKHLRFQGQINHPFADEIKAESLIFPENTQLAIFGLNLKDFISERLVLPQAFTVWLDQNLSYPGQFLLIFGKNPQFALVSKANQTNLKDLKELKIDDIQQIYKEEETDLGEFHFFKVSGALDKRDLTLVLFKLNDWLYLTSSFDAAQELAKNQKYPIASSLKFLSAKEKDKLSLAVLVRNHDQAPLDEGFNNLLFKDARSLAKNLTHLSEFEFILKGSRFSGLINMK